MSWVGVALIVIGVLLAVIAVLVLAAVVVGGRSEQRLEEMRHGEDPWQR